jgi:LCP family protein required for cell wall assembly
VLGILGGVVVDLYAHWRFGQVKKLNLGTSLRQPSSGPNALQKTSENILIVGNNTRTGLAPGDAQLFGSPQEVGGARSDVTMVLHLNPAKGTASLLSIPRDLFVPLPPHSMSGPVGKIDAALNDGAANLINAITGSLGIPIDHYVELNFDGFQNVINAMGGIDMNFAVPLRDSLSGLNITHTGCQHLGGFQALAVVRARHLEYFDNGTWNHDPLSDLSRIRRDQMFLRVLVHTAKTKGLDDPIRAQALLGSLVHEVKLDSQFGLGEMLDLLRRYRSVNPDQIPAVTLPITVVGGYRYQGGSYGDVDMPAQPEDTSVIDSFLGAAPAVAPPNSVTVDVSDISGTSGHGAVVTRQLSALGFTSGSTAQRAAPGQPAETLVHYRPGSLAQAQAVLRALTGPAMMVPDPAVPSGHVLLEAGSGLTVASPAPSPGTETTAPSPPPATAGTSNQAVTPAQFGPKNFDPTGCPGAGA